MSQARRSHRMMTLFATLHESGNIARFRARPAHNRAAVSVGSNDDFEQRVVDHGLARKTWNAAPPISVIFRASVHLEEDSHENPNV